MHMYIITRVAGAWTRIICLFAVLPEIWAGQCTSEAGKQIQSVKHLAGPIRQHTIWFSNLCKDLFPSTYVYIFIFTYIHMSTCVYSIMCAYVYLSICVYIYIYALVIFICIYIYTWYTSMHTFTGVRTLAEVAWVLPVPNLERVLPRPIIH